MLEEIFKKIQVGSLWEKPTTSLFMSENLCQTLLLSIYKINFYDISNCELLACEEAFVMDPRPHHLSEHKLCCSRFWLHIQTVSDVRMCPFKGAKYVNRKLAHCGAHVFEHTVPSRLDRGSMNQAWAGSPGISVKLSTPGQTYEASMQVGLAV